MSRYRLHPARSLTLLAMLIILAGIAIPVEAQSADPATLASISAKQYLVVDSETGEVFAQHDATTRHGIASLTKVFTAIVALEHAPLDFQITAIDSDVFDSSSTLMTGFAPGNTYTVEDLIEGMLLESGNDAATALARGVGAQDGDTPQESIDRFVGWMNDTVQRLGLKDTHFVNPHGLSNKKHYSTPADVGTFMMYAVRNPDFLRLITNRTYTDSLGIEHTSVNRGPEFITSYIGGKTGYDDDTGWCLIELGKQDGVILISVTFDAVAPDIWYEDHQILLSYGFASRADRLAAGSPITNDVLTFVGQTSTDTATVPTTAAAPTDIPTAALSTAGPVSQPGSGPAPVLITGTPTVAPPNTGSGSSGNATRWLPALVILLLVVGLIGFRIIRASESKPDPDPSNKPVEQTETDDSSTD